MVTSPQWAMFPNHSRKGDVILFIFIFIFIFIPLFHQN
jgi:hypothetical protein